MTLCLRAAGHFTMHHTQTTLRAGGGEQTVTKEAQLFLAAEAHVSCVTVIQSFASW